jgi:hypothetical protein
VPGETYEISLELEVTSWIFEPGHRVRLDLAGSDWPNAWAPPLPCTLSIDRARSTLVLPTLQGPSPAGGRPALPPPRMPQAGHRSSRGDVLAEVVWRIEHDVLERETRAIARYGGPSEGDDVAPALEQWYGGTVGVSTEDPGRAFVDSAATYLLRYPEATVRTESRTRIDSDAGAYHVKIEIDVSEGDEPRWSRRWERRIARNLQ